MRTPSCPMTLLMYSREWHCPGQNMEVCTHKVIHCLCLGIGDSVDAKEACVVIVGVEAHVGLGQIVDGHALSHHVHHVGPCREHICASDMHPLFKGNVLLDCN